jgi:hypothetical protein
MHYNQEAPMSMNVFIKAERTVTFKKKNGRQGRDTQTTRFPALQTPTDVSYKIVASSNPVQAYIDWVKTTSRVEQLPVYAEDDIFGENDPIGFEEYDAAQEHIVKLAKWVQQIEEDGYTVKIEVI